MKFGVLLLLLVLVVLAGAVGGDVASVELRDNSSALFERYQSPRFSEELIERIERMQEPERNGSDREPEPYVVTLIMAAYIQTDTNGFINQITISPLLNPGNVLKTDDPVWTECIQSIEKASRFWKVKPKDWYYQMVRTGDEVAICQKTTLAAYRRSFILTIVVTFPPYNAPEFRLDEECNMLKIVVPGSSRR